MEPKSIESANSTISDAIPSNMDTTIGYHEMNNRVVNGVKYNKLDHFARRAGEGSTLVKELLARGVNVHIPNMGLIENTPTGRLILNILLSFAEFERDILSNGVSSGNATVTGGEEGWTGEIVRVAGDSEVGIEESLNVKRVEQCCAIFTLNSTAEPDSAAAVAVTLGEPYTVSIYADERKETLVSDEELEAASVLFSRNVYIYTDLH